jgi:hypothetical protein
MACLLVHTAADARKINNDYQVEETQIITGAEKLTQGINNSDRKLYVSTRGLTVTS